MLFSGRARWLPRKVKFAKNKCFMALSGIFLQRNRQANVEVYFSLFSDAEVRKKLLENLKKEVKRIAVVAREI